MVHLVQAGATGDLRRMTYLWATTPAEVERLEAQGWRIVGAHPVFEGRSVLMRRDEVRHEAKDEIETTPESRQMV